MSHTQTTTKKTFHFDKVDENSNGQIPINTTIRKIKSLELKSATINNPNNIRSENGSNTFGFSYKLPTFTIKVLPDLPIGFNESSYNFQINYFFQVMDTLSIPPRVVTYNRALYIHNYNLMYFTDINQLLSSITTDFNDFQYYGTLIYSINNNNIITFTIQPKPNTIVATISIRSTILTNNLGFTTISNLPSIVANRPYNISLYDPLKYEQTITAILSNKYDDIDALISDINNQFNEKGLAYNGTLIINVINNQDSIQINSNAFNITLKTDNNNNSTLSFDGEEVYQRGSEYTNIPVELGSITGNGSVDLSTYPTDFSYPTTATHQQTSYNHSIDSLLEAINLDFLQNYEIIIANTNGKTYLQIPKLFNSFKLINNVLSRVILGFNGNEILTMNGDNYFLYSTNSQNLCYDNYLNIFINNLTVQGFSSNGRPSTFKIPLEETPPKNQENQNSTKTNYVENTGFKQYHKFLMEGISLAYLQIEFFDRFGFNVPITDYDLTISFETSDE